MGKETEVVALGEFRWLFKPGEIAHVEVVNDETFHSATENLVRRALSVKGVVSAQSNVFRRVLGRPFSRTVRGEVGFYNRSAHRGEITIPIGEVDLEKMPAELQEAFELAFGPSPSDLVINVEHDRFHKDHWNKPPIVPHMSSRIVVYKEGNREKIWCYFGGSPSKARQARKIRGRGREFFCTRNVYVFGRDREFLDEKGSIELAAQLCAFAFTVVDSYARSKKDEQPAGLFT